MFQRKSPLPGTQPAAPGFAFDDARTKSAEEALQALGKITHIQQQEDRNDQGEKGRNICITYRNSIIALRQSPYYLKIKQRHDNCEPLTPAELYYYAMATDDVSKLSLSALQQIPDYFHDHAFDFNFNALLCVRKLEHETNPDARAALTEQLHERLVNRISRYAYSNDNIHYLNLSGANMPDVNLRGVRLSYVNFAGADLSRCALANTDFYYCDLSDANISNADCVYPQNEYLSKHVQAPSISSCLVRNACLDGIQAADANSILSHWEDSDFTGASMRDMKLYVTDFNGAILNGAKIENSTILFAGYNFGDNCSMHNTSLAHSSLHGTHFKCISKDTRLLSDDAMQSTDNLIAELTELHQLASQNVQAYIDTGHKASQQAAFKIKLAECLAYQIEHAALTTDEKVRLLQCAINQPVFAPEASLKYATNTAYNTFNEWVGSLFSSTKTSGQPPYTTPSMDILQETCNKISINIPRHH